MKKTRVSGMGFMGLEIYEAEIVSPDGDFVVVDLGCETKMYNRIIKVHKDFIVQ